MGYLFCSEPQLCCPRLCEFVNDTDVESRLHSVSSTSGALHGLALSNMTIMTMNETKKMEMAEVGMVT